MLSGLDAGKPYGVYYYNRERAITRQVAVDTPEGRTYKKTKREAKDRSEWIGVPVPDAGIPLETVEAARRRLEGNTAFSKTNDREWELSGGILRCGCCGRSMATHHTCYRSKKTGQKTRHYHYYRCQNAITYPERCDRRRSYPSGALEEKVWRLASGFLKDPERLRTGLEEKIRREEEAAQLNRDPEKHVRFWHERISETQEKRRRYQEMAATGLIEFDELRERLSGLDEDKRLAEHEVESLRRHNERLEEMRRDKDTLLAKLVELTLEHMDNLLPEERRLIYRRLGLTVTTREDGTLDIHGELTGLFFGNVELTSMWAAVRSP